MDGLFKDFVMKRENRPDVSGERKRGRDWFQCFIVKRENRPGVSFYPDNLAAGLVDFQDHGLWIFDP
jgi:hypothetical protein